MGSLPLWVRLTIIAVGGFAFEWAWVAYIYAIQAKRKFLATFWCAAIGTLSMSVYHVILRNDDSVASIATYVVFHALATYVQMEWNERRVHQWNACQ